MLHACRKCGRISRNRYCDIHGGNNRPPDNRPNFRDRGYGTVFDRNRKIVLARDPVCSECGNEPSVVADHHPLTRNELLARGIKDPDAPRYMRGLGRHCHARKSGAGR